MRIQQGNNQKDCFWHKDRPGRIFENDEIFPSNMCPILYHTLYPYFLGFHFGARYSYNKEGDCQVSCPAAKGVDTIVRKRDNDGSHDKRILPERRHVIFADVVRVHGDCPCKHKVGDRFIFPDCMKEYYMCPAALNNIFPFLRVQAPPCISMNQLRCPDWEKPVFFIDDERMH